MIVKDIKYIYLLWVNVLDWKFCFFNLNLYLRYDKNKIVSLNLILFLYIRWFLLNF